MLVVSCHHANRLRMRGIPLDIGLQDETTPPRDVMALATAFARAGAFEARGR